jgi:hypothetical protein
LQPAFETSMGPDPVTRSKVTAVVATGLAARSASVTSSSDPSTSVAVTRSWRVVGGAGAVGAGHHERHRVRRALRVEAQEHRTGDRALGHDREHAVGRPLEHVGLELVREGDRAGRLGQVRSPRYTVHREVPPVAYRSSHHHSAPVSGAAVTCQSSSAWNRALS